MSLFRLLLFRLLSDECHSVNGSFEECWHFLKQGRTGEGRAHPGASFTHQSSNEVVRKTKNKFKKKKKNFSATNKMKCKVTFVLLKNHDVFICANGTIFRSRINEVKN